MKVYRVQKTYRLNELVEVRARTRKEARKLAPVTKGVLDDKPVLHECRILDWKIEKVAAPKRSPFNEAVKRKGKKRGHSILQWSYRGKTQGVELPTKLIDAMLAWRDGHLTQEK